MNLDVVLIINWGIGLNVLRSVFRILGNKNVCVVTGSDEDSNDLYDSGIALFCKEHNIRCIAQSKEIVTENIIKADFVISAACPYLIEEQLLDIPKYGVVNLHGSLLPKSRGVSPLNWSLIRAEKVVGLTTHFIDKGMDSGDIIVQSEIQVMVNDNVSTLSDKISLKAPDHVDFLFSNLGSLKKISKKQNLELSTFAPRLKKSNMLIDFDNFYSAFDLVLGVRGRMYKKLLPQFILNGEKIDIAGIDFTITGSNLQDGEILDIIGNDIFFSFKKCFVKLTVSTLTVSKVKNCYSLY